MPDTLVGHGVGLEVAASTAISQNRAMFHKAIQINGLASCPR